MKGPVFAQPFRPRMIMTKMTARITSRRTIAMRTATMGNSLIGLLVAKSVVVAANCFSAGCNRKRNKVSCGVFWIPLPKGLGYGHHRQPICLVFDIGRVVASFCLKNQIFAHENMKKSPQKVAYLSRNSVVSEIFHLLPTYCPTVQMAEFIFPNVAYRATVYRTGGQSITMHHA